MTSLRVPVATGARLHCLASAEGLHFERMDGSDSAESFELKRLRERLPIFASNGFVEIRGDEFVLPYDAVSDLDDEDRALLDALAPPAPLSLRLEDRGFLGTSEFRIDLAYYLGAKEVLVQRTGPFVELRDQLYQLPWSALRLIQEVDALNESDDQTKTDLDQVLRRWGHTKDMAKGIGADLSRYLEQEEVVVADRIAPAILEAESGHTSIVPEIEGVPQSEFQDEYLRHGEVPGRYAVTNSRGHKLRIVLEPEVRQVLEAWTAFRRLSPRERDRVLSDPRQILPEGVSPDVVDLSRYGPRVKAIGEYATSVRAYVSTGQRWDDIGDADADTHDREPEAPAIGIEMELIDGETERHEFGSSDEAESLLERMREASRRGDPVVELGDKKIRVEPALIEALEQLVSAARPTSTVREEAPSGSTRGRPRGVGLLIYTNEEELEFTLTPEEREALDTDSFLPPDAMLPHVELRAHQQQGLAWLVHGYSARRPGVLLADDMGLGKTLQALTFLAWLIENPLSDSLGKSLPPWDPILVVAPPMLLEVWAEEIDRFFEPSVFMPRLVLTTEQARTMRVMGGRESHLGKPVLDVSKLRDYRLVLTSYQTLSAYGLSLGQLDWSVIICDEAQALKDPNTRTSIVFKALKGGFRLALTGTPVETRLLDVWNLFDSLHPGLLGSAKEFSSRYEPKDADGRLAPAADVARDLAAKIGVAGSGSIPKGSRLLRRTKEDELEDLPQKRVHRMDSALSASQRSTYASLVRGFRSETRRGRSLEMLAQLNRLCQHPRLLGGDILGAAPRELVSECPKLESLIGGLDPIAERGEKALIFANFRDSQAILKRVIDDRYGIDAPVLNGDRAGGTKRVHKARLQLIRRFESTPGFGAMIVSPRVGGVGLTITAANHVFHYGRWWNPAREDQCTDRVYRIGQIRDVNVYRLVARDPEGQFLTFDERLDELLEERRLTAESFLMPQAEEFSLARDLASSIAADGSTVEGRDATEAPLRSSSQIAGLSPEGFEALCASVLEAQGYDVLLTPAANDGGIDVVGIDVNEVVLVQCKHTATKHSLRAGVLAELDDGEVYYREKLIPRQLLDRRRIRCLLMTNAPRGRALHTAARSSDTDLICEKDLRRILSRLEIVPSAIGRWLGSREASLAELKQALSARVEAT